jgi:membrane protein
MKHKKIAGIITGIIGAAGAVAAFVTFQKQRDARIAAKSPFHLPWKSHRSVVKQVFDDMGASNTAILAAGIAYNAALAFFPSFAAGLAIASILIAPEQVAEVVRQVNAYLPRDIAGLVTVQLEAQAGKHSGNFIVAAIAIAISLFGASAAIESTLRSLNVAYGVAETRNIVKLRIISICILLITLAIAAIVAVLLVAGDYMAEWGVPLWLVDAMAFVRWPLLVVVMSLAFAALYRYGPDRPRAKWRWVSWGAGISTTLWLLITVLLFLYTRYFSSFSDSYTLFAGIIVLMMWFNFSALALLIGAHVNARLEGKTSLPTTH